MALKPTCLDIDKNLNLSWHGGKMPPVLQFEMCIFRNSDRPFTQTEVLLLWLLCRDNKHNVSTVRIQHSPAYDHSMLSESFFCDLYPYASDTSAEKEKQISVYSIKMNKYVSSIKTFNWIKIVKRATLHFSLQIILSVKRFEFFQTVFIIRIVSKQLVMHLAEKSWMIV